MTALEGGCACSFIRVGTLDEPRARRIAAVTVASSASVRSIVGMI
jgi:hypothetical protein